MKKKAQMVMVTLVKEVSTIPYNVVKEMKVGTKIASCSDITIMNNIKTS